MLFNLDEIKTLRSLHDSCIPSSLFVSRLKQRDETHQAALEKEREELDRVKLELEQAKKDKAAAESALNEKSQQLAEAQEFSRLTETRLEELRVKPTQWLKALKNLNFEMAGKPPCILLYRIRGLGSV